MAIHDREDIARFLDSEPRLVHGRYRDEQTRTFFLDDGRGGEEGLRSWVAQNLECPMPKCEDRRLSLVHRSGSVRPRRDGFKHHVGAGGHAPESIWHSTAKEVVRRWAESRVNGWAEVGVEVPLEGGERTPDVYVAWSRQSVAFEIQYAALSVDQWRRRHLWYSARGIRDVWLWGHAGHHLKAVPGGSEFEEPLFRLNDVHRAMLDSGERCLYWINPLTEEIASGYVRRTHPEHPGVSWRTFATAEDDAVALALDGMEAVSGLDASDHNVLSRNGLFTKSWQRVRLETALHRSGFDPANL